MVRELSLEFENLTGVRRVESIATIPSVIAGSEGGLRLAPAIQDEVHSEEAAGRVAAIVAKDRIASNVFVSKDGLSFAINIRLTDEVDADRSSIIDAVDASVPNENAWFSGVPVFRSEVNSRARDELAMYIHGTLLLVLTVILAVFRSVHAALVTLSASAVGAWIVMGVMGATGGSISLSTMTSLSVSPLCSLSVVESVVCSKSSLDRGSIDTSDA